jgi:hypothetical protein
MLNNVKQKYVEKYFMRWFSHQCGI